MKCYLLFYFLILKITKQIFKVFLKETFYHLYKNCLYLMRIFYYHYYKKIIITIKPHKCRIKNICSSKKSYEGATVMGAHNSTLYGVINAHQKPNNFVVVRGCLFLCVSVCALFLTTTITTKNNPKMERLFSKLW